MGAQDSPKERGLKRTSGVTVKHDSKSSPARRFAVLIGISKYKDPQISQLEFADADADGLYSVITKPEGGDFPRENVVKLTNNDATVANIRAAFRKLSDCSGNEKGCARPGDRVLIFFAGHGFVASNGQGYLAPHDADFGRLPETAYPMEEFGTLISTGIKARDRIVLVDACHSGAITTDTRQVLTRFAAMDSVWKGARAIKLAQGAGAADFPESLFLFTAASDRSPSGEVNKYGHGVFTYFLMRGLEGQANTDDDYVVTADELATYVTANVRKATKNAQIPNSGRGSFDPGLPLSYPKIRAKSAQDDFGTLIVQSEQDGVSVYVDDWKAGAIGKDKTLWVEGLPAGQHKLEAYKRGYTKFEQQAPVLGGQENLITIRFPLRKPAPDKRAQDLFSRGKETYNKGNTIEYGKAAKLFADALTIQPDYADAALYLGRAYRETFQFKEARQALMKALEIEREFPDAAESLAAVYLDESNPKDAIEILTDLVITAPQREVAHGMLSQAYLFRQMYPEAAASASHAVYLKPNYSDAYFYLGNALKGSGDCDGAAPAYREFLKLSANLQSTKQSEVFNFWMRGFVIGGGAKSRAAQKDIWREQRADAYANLGACMADAKSYDEALSDYQQSIALSDREPRVFLWRASAQVAKANASKDLNLLAEAGKSLCQVINLAADGDEIGDQARGFLKTIMATTKLDTKSLGCKK